MPPQCFCYANAYIPGVTHASRDDTSLSRVESVHSESKATESRAEPTTRVIAGDMTELKSALHVEAKVEQGKSFTFYITCPKHSHIYILEEARFR